MWNYIFENCLKPIIMAQHNLKQGVFAIYEPPTSTPQLPLNF